MLYDGLREVNMRFTRLLLCALVLGLGMTSFAQDDANAAKAKYDELTAQLKAGDTKIDWQALRIAGAVSGMSNYFVIRPDYDLGFQYIRDGKYDDALVLGKKILDEDISSPFGYYLAFSAYRGLGQNESAEKERLILVDYFNSILNSGDGKSAKTAWFTVSVIEEKFFMKHCLAVSEKVQGLSVVDGHYFDSITAVDGHGTESHIWFNTDLDMHNMSIQMKRAEEANKAKQAAATSVPENQGVKK